MTAIHGLAPVPGAQGPVSGEGIHFHDNDDNGRGWRSRAQYPLRIIQSAECASPERGSARARAGAGAAGRPRVATDRRWPRGDLRPGGIPCSGGLHAESPQIGPVLGPILRWPCPGAANGGDFLIDPYCDLCAMGVTFLSQVRQRGPILAERMIMNLRLAAPGSPGTS